MFSMQNTKKYLGVVGLAAASSLTLAAAPALAQSYADDGYVYQTDVPSVTVYAPRHAPRDAATGAPYEVVRATRVVDTHDLDLSTNWGMHALNVRVDRAAHEACDEINYRFQGTVDEDNSSCVRRAEDRAMSEVQDTVYYGDNR
jgi:UrcA family protein